MGVSFDFEDGEEQPVAGSPAGDGDFETDQLPSTGETSSGGQLNTGAAEREAEQDKQGTSPTQAPGPHRPTGLEFIIDEISTGKLLP